MGVTIEKERELKQILRSLLCQIAHSAVWKTPKMKEILKIYIFNGKVLDSKINRVEGRKTFSVKDQISLF